MSFVSDETGVDTAQPIELYRFVGSLDTYTYTSANRPVTYNSEVYRPVPVSRSEIKLGDVTERNELKVWLPITAKLVRDYGFDVPPPVLSLQIFRMHGINGAVQPWFSGNVAAITMEGVKAAMIVPSIFSSFMDAEFPNVIFQTQCNHALYSTRCGVNREDFKLIGTVDTIDDRTHIRVTVAADRPNGWLKAGEIITEQERRLILEHDGSLLTLNYPFRSMQVGTDVTLYAGCRHDLADCGEKFDNVVNNLGFEYTPSINPFLTGLR